MQQCLGNINASSRCRLYRNFKEDFELAPYLRKHKNKDLRQCLTKIDSAVISSSLREADG